MRLIIILFCTFSFFNCTKDDNPITSTNPPVINEPPVPLPEGTKYLALGDSYTIGQSVAVADRYPIQLETQLQSDSINIDTTIIIAKTGWTTTDLKNAITATDLVDTFDLVSLLIGVNNQYQGKSIEEYEIEFAQLLQTSIDFAGGKKENVFVVSIPDYAYTPFGNGNTTISQEIDDFNLVNKTITDNVGVSYFDITPISREGLDTPELVASDNLHPSGEQYSRWVNLFYDEVKLKVED
ncbi:MAG: SGNH/GDSL hydrolase family protein [Saprospiraceae bacterium]